MENPYIYDNHSSTKTKRIEKILAIDVTGSPISPSYVLGILKIEENLRLF